MLTLLQTPRDAARNLRSSGRLRALLSGFSGPIAAGTVAVFVLSGIVAPGSVGSGALLSMAPFAAILGLAAIGQTLVAQQGGLDFSIGGVMSLAGVIVTRVPQGSDGRLPLAVMCALAAAVLVGVVNGVVVAVVGLQPIVTTLATNALLAGAVEKISNGFTIQAPAGLTNLMGQRTLGMPNTVWLALALAAVTTVLLSATALGRRLRATGSAPVAARAAGLNVSALSVAAYALCSLAAGLAGVALAGFLRTPEPLAGNAYLLPSIAAVVLGGAVLSGGRCSVIASAWGALFLSQLDQLLASLGATTAVQMIIQAAVVAVGLGLRSGLGRSGRGYRVRRRVGDGAPSAPTLPSGAEDPVPPGDGVVPAPG